MNKSTLEQNEVSEWGVLMANLVGIRGIMSVSNLLNTDLAFILEELEHEDIVCNIVSEIKEGGFDLAHNVDAVEPVLSLTEKIDSIARVMRVNELQENIDLDLQRNLNALQRKVRQESIAGLRKAKIDFFSPNKRSLRARTSSL